MTRVSAENPEKKIVPLSGRISMRFILTTLLFRLRGLSENENR